VAVHHEPGAEGCDTLHNDDRIGALRGVQAFIDRGCRDI